MGLNGAATGFQTDNSRLRRRTLRRGVNRPLYAAVKVALWPFLRLYLRLGVTGRDLVPDSGPVLLAANHRSFLDPFVIGACVRRPVYYVAKRELFASRWQAWLVSSLGGFPIDRGTGDVEAMATAAEILRRGDCLVIFPEGKRVRRGPLGKPRRGVGKLVLESGATVVPIALHGTDSVRRGWRIRPSKVKIRFGLPIALPRRRHATSREAAGATARIWTSVSLQWEWLGGEVAADAAAAQLPLLGDAGLAPTPARVSADMAPRRQAGELAASLRVAGDPGLAEKSQAPAPAGGPGGSRLP